MSDVLAVVFEWGAALRRRKVFHPYGEVVTGSLVRIADPGVGLPVQSGPVVARFSKAVGTSRALPDIAGLAWRMQHDTGPWDLLTVSSPRVRFGRALLTPLRTWSNAVFSTVMPLRYDGRVWWVRVRLTSPIADRGLALDTVARHVENGGVDAVVDQACGTGGFRPLARITFTLRHGGADTSFDPVVNQAAGVTLTPKWLTGLRRAAYQRSRRGRAAE